MALVGPRINTENNMIYFFICTTILFLALFIGAFYISYKSLLLNRKYEQFYNGSVEDIILVSESIDMIINKRPLLVDDPDVHNMVKGLRIVQGILSQYGDIKKVGTSSGVSESKQS
jgi:hypothetical protein